MELLARLHHDHEVVDEQMGRFEEWLKSDGRARGGEPDKLHKLLEPLIERLSRHIRFEEASFYVPLKASGQARPDLMEMLESEHEDLLKTLESLQQLRHQYASSHDETWRAYGFHLIELYREHTEREHRWLFPVLEQLPQRAEGSFDVPARMKSQGAGLPPGELITKENDAQRGDPTLSNPAACVAYPSA